MLRVYSLTDFERTVILAALANAIGYWPDVINDDLAYPDADRHLLFEMLTAATRLHDRMEDEVSPRSRSQSRWPGRMG